MNFAQNKALGHNLVEVLVNRLCASLHVVACSTCPIWIRKFVSDRTADCEHSYKKCK